MLLATFLVAYAVCDFLLTPLGGFETRPVAEVTGLGIATLGVLFVGLALDIVSLALLIRRSRLGASVAIVGALLYFPAALADQTGHFSALRRPAAIAGFELVQAVVALIVIALGIWTLRSRGPA